MFNSYCAREGSPRVPPPVCFLDARLQDSPRLWTSGGRKKLKCSHRHCCRREFERKSVQNSSRLTLLLCMNDVGKRGGYDVESMYLRFYSTRALPGSRWQAQGRLTGRISGFKTRHLYVLSPSREFFFFPTKPWLGCIRNFIVYAKLAVSCRFDCFPVVNFYLPIYSFNFHQTIF